MHARGAAGRREITRPAASTTFRELNSSSPPSPFIGKLTSQQGWHTDALVVSMWGASDLQAMRDGSRLMCARPTPAGRPLRALPKALITRKRGGGRSSCGALRLARP
eukprot:scaffold7953_cov33-Phaeocystis_antarctica.AAC.1